MDGHIFVVNGDITQLKAHAVAYSTSTALREDGNLYPAFRNHLPEFVPLFAALPRPCQLGEAFWLPLPGQRLPHGVVVVAAAGGGRSLDRATKARLAVQNALIKAIRELRRQFPEPEPVLIALPTFRQGMGGDRNVRLESARVQLDKAREVVGQHPGVDVVFVPYTTDSYQVFLQARRDVGLAPVCPIEAAPLPGLIDALRERRCVLFVGAGLSAGAGLPNWQKLIQELAESLGIGQVTRDDRDYYLDLAQWYVEKRGGAELSRLIAGLFGATQGTPTLAHYLLMALPIRLVLTTNYDTLVEQTLMALRRYPVTIVEQKDVVHTGRTEGVCVVKLHGDAARGEGIVLCRDDYDAFFRTRPALALLLEGLLLNQTFLFAGYGLKDPNFRQIYSRIADMLQGAEREAFSLMVEAGTETTPFLTQQWRRKGLHLLAMPGSQPEQRVRMSWLFLDWLADQIVLGAHDLFLARDVPGTGALEALRHQLIEEVGREVEQSCKQPLVESEADRLAEVLAFLTEHGYRPNPRSGLSLWRMWEKLAQGVEEPTQKRRMLIRALQYTERIDDTEHIREQLVRLNKQAQNEGGY